MGQRFWSRVDQPQGGLLRQRSTVTINVATVEEFVEKCNRHDLNYVELGGHLELYTGAHTLSMTMRACGSETDGAIIVQYESEKYRRGRNIYMIGRDVGFSMRTYLEPDMRDAKKFFESAGGIKNAIVFITPYLRPEPK